MFKQNRVFKKDYGRILGLLDATDEAPNLDAKIKFWSGILSKTRSIRETGNS